MNKTVTELWGREFDIVKNGLSEAQVVVYVNQLASEHDVLLKRQENLISLTKLAERTVVEAERLAEQTKQEATEQVKAEASRVIAEAEAQARQIVDEKRAEIVGVATKEAEAIKANAEREAERVKANAEREAEQLLDRQRERIQPQLKEMAQGVYSQLLSELESLRGQVTAMEEELEHKLFQPIEPTGTATVDEKSSTVEVLDSTSPEDVQNGTYPGEELQATPAQSPAMTDETGAIEESMPSLDDILEPTTYEEKVELEFLPPVNILQLLEIDKYLEGLPEVEATEIIPITDKPVIMVYLRESIELIDVLGELPEVSELSEDTNGAGALGDTTQGNGRSRKIQIKLSGSTQKEKAEG